MPGKDQDIKEVEAKELKKQEKEEISKKVVYTDSSKNLQFYERLRNNISSFISRRTGDTGGKLASYLLALPDFFILLTRLALDKRVPGNQKLLVGGIITYIILPIDIIPDFIPVLGYIDDLVLAVFGLNIVLNEIDTKILLENWSGKEDLLFLLQKITFAAEHFLDRNLLRKIKRWLSHIKN
ncbi:MAG: DUF1232 domain-containing protein [Candidatus Cloacimonetes bacterium]|nr:DUF1232 domain-containing protein [Candidatus Cloacimonadota bacterium]